MGGNFVDISLKVIVMNDVGTLLVNVIMLTCINLMTYFIQAIQPTHKHGTTLPRPGLERQGVAINFSTHILQAYQKAEQAAEMGQLLVIEAEEQL
jgi:hypothetical protein